MDKSSELKWILERQLNWISAADSKLTILASFPLAMLTISLFDVSERLEDIGWQDVPFIISTILLCGCLYYCKAALTPRLFGPNKSVIFFGAISKLSSEEYRSAFSKLSLDDYLDDLMVQIHRNSEIASTKHRNISLSVYMLAFSVPIWLLSIALG